MNGAKVTDDELIMLRHGDAAARTVLAELAAVDPDVARRLGDWDQQDAALRALYDPIAEEPLPARLRAALMVPRPYFRLGTLAAAVAIFALGVGAGWFAVRFTEGAPMDKAFADAALRAHATFVVEALHPVEVLASDEAHLVGWLSKRLGERIDPPHLGAQGFALMGGRIVPDANGAAALMMYEDNIGRRLTLYVTSASADGETAFRFVEGSGAQGFWWVDATLGYALIGDLPRDLLRTIAVRAYEQLVEI